MLAARLKNIDLEIDKETLIESESSKLQDDTQ